TGKRWIVVVSKEQGAPTIRAQAEAQQAEIERGVQSDPLVQAVLNRFPGAKIVGVTQNPESGEAAPDVLPDSEDQEHAGFPGSDEAGSAAAIQDAGDAGRA